MLTYIRAIKWATLRIQDRGIVAFVTNGGFLESNAADGMRQALAEEFSAIHVFNLRGNRRQGGAEGRPIWEAFAKGTGGSIATIAIVVLVKRPENSQSATVLYSQVSDFTTATEKVAEVVAAGSISGITPTLIVPNEHGDWLHQRGKDFASYLPTGSKSTGLSVFGLYSKGVNTARSNWVYGSSQTALKANVAQLLSAYESDRQALATDPSTPINADEHQIKWSRTLESAARRGVTMQFDPDHVRKAVFRPFTPQWLYWDRYLNDQLYSTPYLFPDGLANVGLPRIPFAADFRAFADSGKQLAVLHLGYESAEPYPLKGLDVAGPGGDADYGFFAVRDKKMAFGKPTPEQKAAGERYDRSVIHYNDHITLRCIPAEAYRYTLGSRSAIEWIIDRYWVKTDKASGIVNDPNDWSREVGDPRYILDLLARIVTVSLETMTVVDALPPLDIRHGDSGQRRADHAPSSAPVESSAAQ